MLRRIVLPFIAFCMIMGLVALLLPLDRYFPTVFGGGRNVLILFDEPSPERRDQDRVDALMLRQLLGHFPAHTIQLVSTGEYEKESAKKYDVVFYIGTKSAMPVPSFLVDDLFFRNKTTVWINTNLDKMAARHSLDGFGIRMVDLDDSHETNRVEYKGKSLWKLDKATYAVEVINEQIAQVLAWAAYEEDAKGPSEAQQYGPEVTQAGQEVKEEKPQTELPPLPDAINFEERPPLVPIPQPQQPISGREIKLPWIVRGGNFWYVASNPFSYHIEGGAYLAFCDVLHDIFRTRVKEDHPALVRIEDVHAAREMKQLIEAADYLHARSIPFAFTLVPVYVNPETNDRRYLSSDPHFLETVRGMIARGGIPILHGYTHQWDGETAVDYEFWSSPDPSGKPLATGPDFAATRIVKALAECITAEIYPISWTTPHYVASQIDYRSIRDFFTTVVERRQPIDLVGADQFFPYVIYRDMHDQIIIPENLGYVQPTAGRDPKAILKDADNGLVVRDGWGSFFFHTFLDLQLMKDIVEGLEQLGYRFVSLAEYNCKVRTHNAVILTGVGEVDMDLNGQYLREFTLKPDGRKVDETFSFRPITGKVQKYASTHPGEISVFEGGFTRPEVTARTFTKFRPFVSGITSPVSIFLLMIGMMIMLTFLVIWVFLLVRKTTAEIREAITRRQAR